MMQDACRRWKLMHDACVILADEIGDDPDQIPDGILRMKYSRWTIYPNPGTVHLIISQRIKKSDNHQVIGFKFANQF
jgi:hypothetical protein